MTKKVFQSIALAAALVFVASVALIMGVLYNHFLNDQLGQMQAQASLTVQGVEKSGKDFFRNFPEESNRITWIDKDGKVLYDTDADPAKMENHLQREEVQQAVKTGKGESFRYSTTLLERRLYVTQKAADGSVIRVSDSQHSILGLLLGMLQQILIVAVITLALAFFLAWRLTKRILQPLNDINLSQPEQVETYEELQPLLNRIQTQQQQMAAQARQLRQRQKEFDAFTANMEEGLLVLNEKREVISINHAAEEILGLRAHLAGELLPVAEDLPQLGESFDSAMTGERKELPAEIAGRQYKLHSSPVMSGKKVTAVIIFILDVTERNKTEQIRKEFTANVSHELKTPLQTISGSAELLAAGLVKPEDTAEFAGKIHAESRRMIALIDDIIGLSQLDEENGDLKKEEIDLYAVAEHTISLLSSEARESEVAIRLSGESTMVMGDLILLGSVVHNLCDNAIKYSERGSEVAVSVRQEEEDAVLTVADEGIGIPAEDQDRIFERFYRVDKSRSKSVGGTGLGLSIVKHAVQQHGGTIRVESAPGSGTTIQVRIPTVKGKKR